VRANATHASLSTWLQAAAVVPSASHEPGAWRRRWRGMLGVMPRGC